MKKWLAALVVGAAMVPVVLGPATARGDASHAIIGNPACTATSLGRNDDGSAANVPLPFSVNFFGTTYSSLSVNNNGNVTFDGPLSTYTPFPLATTNHVIIAPFFADVDTQGQGSGIVQYGSITSGVTEFGGHKAFCVDWINVGYYSSRSDKLNSFQLLLVQRDDKGPGDFDIVFNYDKIQWETGSASGGVNGLGGNSARAGYSNGSTSSFELPGSASNGAFLDTNPATGLISNSVNSPLQLGRYVFPVRNGSAVGNSISGQVWANTIGTPVSGAVLQACPTPADTPCRSATTNSVGSYVFNSLPDHTSGAGVVDHDWTIVVNPPSGSGLNTGELGPITVAGIEIGEQDVVLRPPVGIPPGTSLTSPSFGTLTSGVPTVHWHDPLTVSTTGCFGGTATAVISVSDGYRRRSS